MFSSTKSRFVGKTFLQTLFFFLLVTKICFAQWVQVVESSGILDIAARNSTIFAIASDSAVYRSTDNGINWLQIVESGALDIAIAPTGLLFMVTGSSQWFWEDSLYKSSDNGNTWTNLNIMEQLTVIGTPTNVTVSPMEFVFCRIFNINLVGGQSTHLALSTDDGSTWTSPGDTILGGDLFDFRDQNVITSGFSTGRQPYFRHVYLSSDYGYAWSLMGDPISVFNNVLSMCLNGNILIGGSDPEVPGLFLSSDTCNSWTKVSSLIPEVGLSIESGGILVGNDGLGVFLFSDNGDSLRSFNEGLSNLNVHTFTTDNNGYVYLGTNDGVWRRPLSELVPVEELSTPLPSSFNLSQNYPNPFNPVTTIKYQIPELSIVTLKVFDILGNEIETLVNEEKTVGTYEITWYATSLPSGVYFYQLKAGEYVSTKKMLLLK